MRVLRAADSCAMPRAEEELTRTAYDTVADAYADRIRGTEPEQVIDVAMVDLFASLVPEPRHVLDVGCGAGRMFPYLTSLGCDVEGVDLSPRMVARARHDHPQHTVHVMSLTDPEYPDDHFQGVFSWYSTIHNPDQDVDRMVAEMVRVLRPAGLLLLAFQTGQGMRRVGKGYHAMGYDVLMNRYHRPASQVAEIIERHGLDLVATLDRAPMGTEPDGQAVLIARHRM